MASVFVADSPVPVAVQIPLAANGNPLTVTSASVTVTDETLAVIDEFPIVNLPSAGQLSFSFTVPAQDNALLPLVVDPILGSIPFGAIRALRIVTTTMVTASGVFNDVQNYIINNPQPLVRMVNSFITVPETILVRYEMATLNGWDAATPDARIAALGLAWKNMLNLRYRFPIGVQSQSRITDFYGMSVDNVFGRIYEVIADISFYTEEDWDNWPILFRQAVQRAQMAEADFILNGDPVGNKRDAGIISETTGESSMSFKKIPEVRMPICAEALKHLSGYVQNTVLVARG